MLFLRHKQSITTHILRHVLVDEPHDECVPRRNLIGADGEPIVGWEPDLNAGGKKHERVYTVEGRESLTDGNWGPTNAASRFFRVKVSLP